MDLKVIFFVLCAVISKSEGNLQCYACGFSSADTDQSCLTITNSTLIVNCEQTYCTIMRQEFRDPAGAVSSFVRGCESEPDFLNHEISDSTFRTFYRACTSDLCNTGNGVQSVVGGTLAPERIYNSINLLVPGTGEIGSATHVHMSLALLILNIVAVYFF